MVLLVKVKPRIVFFTLKRYKNKDAILLENAAAAEQIVNVDISWYDQQSILSHENQLLVRNQLLAKSATVELYVQTIDEDLIIKEVKKD